MNMAYKRSILILISFSPNQLSYNNGSIKVLIKFVLSKLEDLGRGMLCTINDCVPKCNICGRGRVNRYECMWGKTATLQSVATSFHCRLSNINMKESDMMLKEGKTGDL